jgi:hypothetical protein
VQDTENQMFDAYAFLHCNFPKIQLPQLYFFVSGCNLSVFQEGNFAGIGADLYLGSDYPLYQKLSYHYLIQNMKPENIPIDISTAILSKNFLMESKSNRLIDYILYNGKLLYLLSKMLPKQTEENISGYTAEQLAWCKKYERDVWALMIEKKHLFSIDLQLIETYINDAPFTQSVSQDSPGRLGSWIGWQIVKNYVKNNDNIDIQQLAAENDYQKILEKSKYKP